MNNIYRTPGCDPDCTQCELGIGQAIHSHCFSKFEDSKLFILSAYPGNQELKSNLTLCPYDNWNPKRKNINAGTYLDQHFKLMFDKDPDIPNYLKPFYDIATVRGNAVRCSTRKGKEVIDVKDKHLSSCRFWLKQDIASLHPNTVIMVCGKEAVNSLFGDRKHLFGNSKSIPSLFKLRRQIWLYDKHPVVITENPAQVVKSLLSNITKFTVDKNGLKLVKEAEIEITPAPYSTSWHFNRDIQLVKDIILFNIGNQQVIPKLMQINGFNKYKKLIE
jgi:hypothetical protein